MTETGNTEIADRFIQAITDLYLLSANPYIGRRRDDDLRPGLRSFPVGRYLTIYRIDKEDVLILHVLSGDRNHGRSLLQS